MRAFARNVLHRRHKHEHHHDHHHHDHHHHEQSGSGVPSLSPSLSSSVFSPSFYAKIFVLLTLPISRCKARMVFAHYMVGLTHGQTPEEWTQEIRTADAACIDGFALNIGSSDPYTLTQLRQAFAAAEAQRHEQGQRGHEFVLFLSFDMAAGHWDVDQLVALIREFRDSPVYYTVDGQPLVSTFEGPGWADNWPAVSRAAGGIFLVPDWSSLGPHGVGNKADLIDGAFSWCAWPRADQQRMTTEEDVAYGKTLRDKGKIYMAGVSPWFYTRLPQWNKNWYSTSESLWFDRWSQILDLKPDLVQIISWNDFGESSYICDPLRPSQVVPGADIYVSGHSHAAFRATLPFLIKAYKAGNDLASCSGDDDGPEEDCAIAWYRTTPAECGPDGGTVWGQGGSRSASQGARDVISVMSISKDPTAVTISIGDQEVRPHHHQRHGYVSFAHVQVEGRTGPVRLSMHGRSATGPAIINDCPPSGHVMFNCVSIQV
ncbi:family 71 glycoside hydrolase [Cryphonectria parasitica EP155]|uniref:Family 71 glycoside hydrolase n=1 Tax=Cryphonectria parasitica (strain ATCC 38755 / EP155) TaxID=660469 RepID=A0A9P4XWV6_CRYP1|nr:family 71 glycoside hydrolase [Cryphonectria parasitica EP155]KAF3762045.1 family 71 glycoside hydrolase [Cryphonectria parasitica EP155]